MSVLITLLVAGVVGVACVDISNYLPSPLIVHSSPPAYRDQQTTIFTLLMCHINKPTIIAVLLLSPLLLQYPYQYQQLYQLYQINFINNFDFLNTIMS